MKLNGWQRLWIVLSFLWMVHIAWKCFEVVRDASSFNAEVALFIGLMLLVGIAVAGLAYVAGMVVAWVIRGFKKPAA